MQKIRPRPLSPSLRLSRSLTGIQGLDAITDGGLPRGRTALVCGGAGCGKTLLGAEFLVHGAREFGEPGVFMSFEETEAEISANVAPPGFDLPGLVRKRIALKRQIGALRSEHEAGAEELRRVDGQAGLQTRRLNPERNELGRLRQADRPEMVRRSAKAKPRGRHA